MEMAAFNGNEGHVMSLTIAADDDFKANNAVVQLTNVLLVSTEQEVYNSSDVMTKVSEASGVEQVLAGKQIVNVRYINVAGQESETPFNGVNIVVTRYTDGTQSVLKTIK